ncbi:MAG: serine hydrolase domain-containing protein [Planctomycetales bacterium]
MTYRYPPQTVRQDDSAFNKCFDKQRWDRALDLIQGWCDAGHLPAAGVQVGNGGVSTGPHLFGRARPAPDAPPIGPDAIFLIASITKPIVATGVLLLAERGLLALDDRVERFVPAFGKHGKHAVTLRHLLTHTSGLPDMLPNNVELRAAGAPLSAFVEGTCGLPLDFLPGRGVQYQSTGFAMLGEVIHQVSGKTCSQFLQDELFDPLEMTDTALGAPASWFEGPSPKVQRIAEIRLPEEQQQATTWNWNTRYWRQLGVPWGGLLTTPADLGKFASMLINEGFGPTGQVLCTAAVRAATRNQLEAMADVPPDERRCRPWGLGWRLNWPAHSANFGDFLGPRTYGHWGATGTVMWIDPDRGAYAILLTTQPQEPHGSYLARASNAIAAALR